MVLSALDGATDIKASFSNYCKDCELSHWCDRKNKSFKLATTIEALEYYNMREEAYPLEKKAYKPYELALIVKRLIEIRKES